MSSSKLAFRVVSLALLLAAAALGGPLSAQFQAGDLYGTITDESGAPLADVKVTLVCPGARYEGTSDEDGQVRFGDLSPGNYQFRAVHEDFDPVVYDTVEILVGRTTTVQLRMAQEAERTRVVTS
jgi:protocatechuate 3,4-dioxygenase beta subunit